MKTAFGGASGAVIAFCLATYAGPALAQDNPATATADTDDATEVQEVVVTGSLIRGTAVDTALPVEVYSNKELEQRGSPTALEFAKTLSISGPVTGESYYFGGTAPGTVTYNLRGIGADKTLVLLNGRRMSSNTSNIPSIAIARTEILKDGAAVTYGADATGGVINFITRSRFVGLEAQGQYKSIKGSNGDYSAGILGGFGSGAANFMWSAEYEHRSRLHTLDRDFTYDSLDPTVPGYNPAPWSTTTNLAAWQPRGTLPAIPSATAAGEFGAAVGSLVPDFTQASCLAVGGRFDNVNSCSYNYIGYYNLVENQDTYRLYAQLNADLTEKIQFHFDASYGEVKVPEVFGSPAQPISRGPALATGATHQFYVPITNPYAAAFAAAHNITGVQGFTPFTYRLLAHGGNLAMSTDGYGVPDYIDNQVWRVSSGVKGELGSWTSLAKNVNYDVAVTYNESKSFFTHPDTIGFRLQQALNGFGGPNCNAPDLDPNRFGTQNPAAAGTNGCQWWNPFASSFASQPVFGLSNPSHVAGAENSLELTRWMFDPRATETLSHNLTLDAVVDGKSGIGLPGGDIGWAVGWQLRNFESRQNIPSTLYNGSVQCEWPHGTTSANLPSSTPLEANPLPPNDPNFRGCTPDAPGPFVLFAPQVPQQADRHQYSVFGELEIPVLKDLTFQAAVRHEEFSGGLAATVYKVAGKWHVWGPLSVRGSYGTNYQTPPVGTIPGSVNIGARNYTIAGSNWLAATFVTASSLEPETAKAGNMGLIWQSRGLAEGHTFRFILDYFDIRTEDEIGQIADPNQIANLVFNNAGKTSTCDPAVQPLLNRVTFNTPCTVGMSAIGAFSNITTEVGNGPGQTTNGYDLQVYYGLPFAGGDLSFNVTATKVTELRTGPTSLDGVVISTGDDRLGTLNFATIASAAPELRANAHVNYHIGRQNFRLAANYVSAVKDERAGVQYGENGEEWITVDFIYHNELRDDLALTLGVDNIFDRDPPPAQEEFGYDPRLGNPLGRTLQIGVKKTF